MERSGAELLVEHLRAEGVKVVFGVSGTEVLPLMDVLYHTPEIRYIQSQHEQGAMYMANGYAAAARQPGISVVSPGPGTANSLAGLAQAYYTSTPSILICMREVSLFSGLGASQHHDLEATKVFAPVTKMAVEVRHVERLREHLQAAFRVSLAGRKGPCFVSIPSDILRAKTADNSAAYAHCSAGPPRGNPHDVERVAHLLETAERPVIVAGGGVNWSGAHPELLELAELLSAPVGSTGGHGGIIPEDHPLAIGSAFYAGPPTSARTLREADLVLAVGCTFSYLGNTFYSRAGQAWPWNAKLAQIDIDPCEIGKMYPVDAAVVGDAKLVLQDLIDYFRERRQVPAKESPWLRTVLKYKEEWETQRSLAEKSDQVPIRTWRLLGDLRKALPREAVVVGSGGGTHSWVDHAFPCFAPNTIGGWNPLGGDFCGAMGAKVAMPDRVVACIIGDGSMMMTLPEMATAVSSNIPILCVVRHNGVFGNMRRTQAEAYGGRFFGTDVPTPNLANIAREFGAYGETVSQPSQIIPAVRRALESGKPALLDVLQDSSPEELMPPVVRHDRSGVSTRL